MLLILNYLHGIITSIINNQLNKTKYRTVSQQAHYYMLLYLLFTIYLDIKSICSIFISY